MATALKAPEARISGNLDNAAGTVELHQTCQSSRVFAVVTGMFTEQLVITVIAKSPEQAVAVGEIEYQFPCGFEHAFEFLKIAGHVVQVEVDKHGHGDDGINTVGGNGAEVTRLDGVEPDIGFFSTFTPGKIQESRADITGMDFAGLLGNCSSTEAAAGAEINHRLVFVDGCEAQKLMCVCTPLDANLIHTGFRLLAKAVADQADQHIADIGGVEINPGSVHTLMLTDPALFGQPAGLELTTADGVGLSAPAVI
jgi:hypothetical protein